MKKPSRRPADSAFQMRPACTSAKVAEGKACFCASGSVRYCTAWAEEADITAAAGTVQSIHFVMLHLEEEPDGAEERIRQRADGVVVLDMLIGRLEHDLGRREHGEARAVELGLPGASRHVQVGAGEPAGL